jgi:hypothetical protein
MQNGFGINRWNARSGQSPYLNIAWQIFWQLSFKRRSVFDCREAKAPQRRDLIVARLSVSDKF